MRNPAKTVWTKTNTPNLYRHQNRRYYARLFVGGKEIWKSLKTKLKSVAVERLQELVVNARQQRASGVQLAGGTLTFAQVVELYRQNFHRDVEIAEGTKNFREAGIKRVLKTWPGISEPVERWSTTKVLLFRKEMAALEKILSEVESKGALGIRASSRRLIISPAT